MVMGGGWCVGMAPCGQVRFLVMMRGIRRVRRLQWLRRR